MELILFLCMVDSNKIVLMGFSSSECHGQGAKKDTIIVYFSYYLPFLKEHLC
jgi:hypothetical protein